MSEVSANAAITRQVFGAVQQEDLREAVKSIPSDIMLEELMKRTLFQEQQLVSIGKILLSTR